MDHAPVVAIVGQQARPRLGGAISRKWTCSSLFKDVAHEYVHMASDPGQSAIWWIAPCASPWPSGPSPASSCPTISRRRTPCRSRRTRMHGPLRASAIHAPRIVPRGGDLQRAAERVERGQAGGACWSVPARLDATDEVIETAELPGRRRGQGAARQGGRSRRPAVCHRLDRSARHQAELGPDDGVRHPAHDRQQFSLSGDFCRRKARRAGVQIDIDSPDAEHPLPDGGRSRRGQRRDACARCCRCSNESGPAPGGRRSRRACRQVVEGAGGSGDERRHTAQSAARFLGAVLPAA